MPMFCRHNRLVAKCPICLRENAAELQAYAPSRAPRTRTGSTAKTGKSARRPHGLKTRKLERAAEDGYSNPLVPGLRATADAERLAGALTDAVTRLNTLTATSTDDALRQAIAGAPDPDALVAAYREWVHRHGGEDEALAGDNAWSPTRRFARLFERIPALTRGQKFEFLTILGASALLDVEADGIHVESDATSTAAKRVLLSGDRMLLERRAAALAKATGVPIAALDHAFSVWESGEPVGEPAPAVAQALRV